ncbi:MAG: hypothetical protein RIU67_516 [Actinomycetota bacterium]|jgi:hypothetical protein
MGSLVARANSAQARLDLGWLAATRPRADVEPSACFRAWSNSTGVGGNTVSGGPEVVRRTGFTSLMPQMFSQSPTHRSTTPRVEFVLSVAADTLKNLVTAGSFVPIVIGLILVKIVVSTVARLIIVVVALALGVTVFTQRAQIDDCIEKSSVSTAGADVKCSLFGVDVDLQL